MPAYRGDDVHKAEYQINKILEGDFKGYGQAKDPKKKVPLPPKGSRALAEQGELMGDTFKSQPIGFVPDSKLMELSDEDMIFHLKTRLRKIALGKERKPSATEIEVIKSMLAELEGEEEVEVEVTESVVEQDEMARSKLLRDWGDAEATNDSA